MLVNLLKRTAFVSIETKFIYNIYKFNNSIKTIESKCCKQVFEAHYYIQNILFTKHKQLT